MKDITPFQTRSKLLNTYASQTKKIWRGEDPYPVAIEVNPSNFCNQGCKWCISENIHSKASMLDLDHPGVQKFFSDFSRLGGKALGWSGGGEPTLHPKFAKALEGVTRSGIHQGLMTHGAFSEKLIDPIAQNCDWVRISIDTHDRLAYAKKRNTKPDLFDRALNNAKVLAHRGVSVGLNMNVAMWNIDHIEDLYRLACDVNASYLQVRPTLQTPFPHIKDEDLLPREAVSNILKRLDNLSSKSQSTKVVVSYDKFEDITKSDYGRTYSGCLSHRIFIVLNWDGDLMVCMYHLSDKRFSFGNIYENGLENIWKSEKRRQVLNFCEEELNHGVHGCQVCCKGHEINKILFDVIDVEAEHDEQVSPFI